MVLQCLRYNVPAQDLKPDRSTQSARLTKRAHASLTLPVTKQPPFVKELTLVKNFQPPIKLYIVFKTVSFKCWLGENYCRCTPSVELYVMFFIFQSNSVKPFFHFVTGAGSGLLLTYATYMSRQNSVVKLGILLPVCNNLIR